MHPSKMHAKHGVVLMLMPLLHFHYQRKIFHYLIKKTEAEVNDSRETDSSKKQPKVYPL